jgi:hypothetical protein
MDVAIPIVFPDYRIAVELEPTPVDLLPWFTFDNFKTPEYQDLWPGLGHAGIFFVNGRTGLTKYYEYGRYDTKGLGLVRKRSIPNARVADGQIVRDSLRRPLHEIALKAGHGGRIEGVYIEVEDGFSRMLAYAELRESQNINPKRTPYGLWTNSCVHFTKDVVAAAGIDTPWMIDPRPNSYIGEFRNDYPDVDYSPRTGQFKIEGESDQ